MRHGTQTYDAVELLPTDADSRDPHGAAQSPGTAIVNGHTADPSLNHPTGAIQPSRSRRRLPGITQLCYVLPLLVSIVPLALLLAYSESLTENLAASACSPGGKFIMPFSSSVWNGSSFFEITIPFLGPEPSSCSRSVQNPFAAHNCQGYSFTQVKVIDLAWDVLVGRGGQGVLVIIAYRLFSRVLADLMERGDVAYDAFATVAFDTGTVSSMVPLFRQVVGLTPVPRTRRAILCFLGILLATVYIVAVPSLVSAMTGYATAFVPYMRLGSNQMSNGSLVDCYPALVPAWGRIGLSYLQVDDGQVPFLFGANIDNFAILTVENSFPWIDYYDTYRSTYDECPQELDISSCPAAQKDTVLTWDYGSGTVEYRVLSPMPGIVPYSNVTDAEGAARFPYWSCGYGQLINSSGLLQSPLYEVSSDSDDQSVGVCQADQRYAWGFSFLFAFLVAVLHLIFAVLMYALWLPSRNRRKASGRAAGGGHFPDAVTMVTQAQEQYGARLNEWSAAGLNKDILHGKTGMSFVGDQTVKRRKAEQSEALGDERGGDWGGELLLNNHRS